MSALKTKKKIIFNKTIRCDATALRVFENSKGPVRGLFFVLIFIRFNTILKVLCYSIH